MKIHGPENTPYENGVYTLIIRFPEAYPLEKPELFFETKIWHPNVCPETGKIQLRSLCSGSSISFDIEEVLETLETVLAHPTINYMEETPSKLSPMSQGFVYNQYCANHRKFQRTAEYWRDRYAMKKDNVENLASFKKKRCFSIETDDMLMEELNENMMYRHQSQADIFVSGKYGSIASQTQEKAR